MLEKLPVLADYDVSPLTGFLPETLPLRRLNSYFDAWEDIVENLPALVLTRQVRPLVDAMPHLDTKHLQSEPEWRRAVSILSFISHAYVWAGDAPSDHIPTQLAEPWLAVSAHFDLPPICSYAAVCLWNHKTVVPVDSPEKWTLDNIATLNTFTGAIDESWFYLVSTAMERQGAPCLATGLAAIRACREDKPDVVIKNLQLLAEAIDGLTTTLMRMFEMCDPHIFYFRLRPYLAGWKNMAEAGLPKGVRYGDETEYRQISGGSNAQSSLIQALDIILNVEHHPTGTRSRSKTELPTDRSDRKPEKSNNNFIHEMRKYMPIKHRQFLEHLTLVAHIRDYVTANAEREPALVISYDACLAMLRNFRDKHIQIVSRYIVIPSQQAKKQKDNLTKREGLAASSDKKKIERGTGGTALIPFLKQARDETGDSAAGSWGRRILSENVQTGEFATAPATTILKRPVAAMESESYAAGQDAAKMSTFKKVKTALFGSTKPAEDETRQVGLSGDWKTSKDKGGIPHW